MAHREDGTVLNSILTSVILRYGIHSSKVIPDFRVIYAQTMLEAQRVLTRDADSLGGMIMVAYVDDYKITRCDGQWCSSIDKCELDYLGDMDEADRVSLLESMDLAAREHSRERLVRASRVVVSELNDGLEAEGLLCGEGYAVVQ